MTSGHSSAGRPRPVTFCDAGQVRGLGLSSLYAVHMLQVFQFQRSWNREPGMFFQVENGWPKTSMSNQGQFIWREMMIFGPLTIV